MLKKVVFAFLCLCVLVVWSSPTFAQDIRTTKSGYLASVSEAWLDKAVEYAVARDDVALQKLIDSKLVFVLKGGLRVYVVDTKIFSGIVKIRPVGETFEVWTLIEAISN
ncbi:hypothetical protein GGQ74_000054 [Desulfobaculum xiamenense]|uniref:Uncharacterized protein n=1 Tax=Desulfobaculum xiamenense TaxID=995050 RepID=A0A846QMD8_9BACT|nr:hypothetical protein [Desulfobaculum xiamenense]NJB66414.1 hypothetical protein [Desulfobaculum xiamenense]